MWFSSIFAVAKSFLGSKSSILIDILLGVTLLGVVYFGYNKYTSLKQALKYSKQTILYQKELTNKYKDKVTELEYNNKQNLAKIDKLKQTYLYRIRVLKNRYNKAKNRVKIVTQIETRIKYVKAKDDGMVAPVLNNTLSRLRKYQTSTNESNNSKKN